MLAAIHTAWVCETKGDSWPRHGGAGPHEVSLPPRKAHNPEVTTQRFPLIIFRPQLHEIAKREKLP